MIDWSGITAVIQAHTHQSWQVRNARELAGGCINRTFLLEGAAAHYFVKLHRLELTTMFAAEAAGLKELAATYTIKVPEPICHGDDGKHSYLVLEYLELQGTNASSDALLGERLAALHRIQQPYFGWHTDNTIGSTPQSNPRNHDWISFWRTQRLHYQLQLAAGNGYGGSLQRLGERLCDCLPVFFSDYQPQPSLLHGDLWSGNYAQQHGEPVIFDPACYYGDREADLAMTELFGGFGRDFYAAYQASWPLDSGYAVRKTLYNLYHILNHLNLFGGGYLHQANSMIGQLLAET